MSERKLRSIKCTNCAAPLTLHGGGHKIRSINCEFCGSVLDARQHFKVLHKFSQQAPPQLPFKLGMQGIINDIQFIIIGMIVWEDSEAYRWTDFMLFSPTRGYAWLTYYQGHLVFSRKTRDIPNLNIWNLAPKYEFSAGANKYKFFERSRAKIAYVAGELTWIAKQNDNVHLIEAIAPPYLYSVEHNGNEVEYGLGEYIEDPTPVYASFGVDSETNQIGKPQTIHPAQPYRSKFFEPLSKAAKPFVILAGIVALIITFMFGGREIYSEQIAASTLSQGANTREFNVTQANRLLELNIDTNLKNAWAYFDISVRRGANDIFSFGKGVSFYEGYDGEGYWSEGSRSATAHFKVPEAGQYVLHIQTAEGGTGETGNTPQPTALRVQLKQGYISSYYFIILLILAAIAVAAGYLARMMFESRRWKSVLGDDD